MKHGTLRSIAHNLADSIGSGVSLLLGYYDLDVFGDAARSAGGQIDIDFLSGTVTAGAPSPDLIAALLRSHTALDYLCRPQGVSVDAFRRLEARFIADAPFHRFSVTIADDNGRQSTTDYTGIPGRRVKVADHLGRLRPKPINTVTTDFTASAA